MKYLLFIISMIALTSFTPKAKPGKLWTFVVAFNDGEFASKVYVRAVAAKDSTTASHLFLDWVKGFYKKKIRIPTDRTRYAGRIISEETILYP